MSVVEFSRRLAKASQRATPDEQDHLAGWFYAQNPLPESIDDAPDEIRALIEKLESSQPTGLRLEGAILSELPQVLITEDGFSDPTFVVSADIKDDTATLVLTDGDTKSIEIASGSIEKYQSGTTKFLDKDTGTNYMIRAIDDSDGYWLSSYQIALPVEALATLVSQTEEGRTVDYLQNDGESMIAFQTPGQDDIDIVLYINQFGRWVRDNGEWFLSAQDDDSIDDTRAYEVNKDTVQDFLQVFDNGPLSAGDVKKYLTLIKG